MTNGKQKGGRAEREVARIIQPWWAKYEPSALFSKTPQSGGWGKTSNRQIAVDKKACGDLVTNSERFPFCVEVKWREGWSADNFFNGRKSPPWGWWVQTILAAQEQGGVPMMWARKKRAPGKRVGEKHAFPWIVCVPHDYYLSKKLSTPDIIWTAEQLDSNDVDYGGIVPVGYIYTRFIQMAAKRMAK